jgi:GNAT superfamily N-acetyltransferase
MDVRRLRTGDENSAVLVVEGLKFPSDGVVGITVDPVYMHTFLADDSHYFLAAYVGEKPVGYLFAYRLARFDGRLPGVFLYEVEVLEEYRRQGVGRALVEEIKRLAVGDGCRKMFVPTSKHNQAAMALYRAAGGQEGEDGATAFEWNWPVSPEPR